MREKINIYSPKDGDEVYLKVCTIKSLLFYFMSGCAYDYSKRTIRGVNWKKEEFYLEDDNGKCEWYSWNSCVGKEIDYYSGTSKSDINE